MSLWMVYLMGAFLVCGYNIGYMKAVPECFSRRQKILGPVFDAIFWPLVGWWYFTPIEWRIKVISRGK